MKTVSDELERRRIHAGQYQISTQRYDSANDFRSSAPLHDQMVPIRVNSFFCGEPAANQTMMAKHERCCLHMPFDMWIARTRLVLESQPDRTIPCTHCGTLFQSKGGAVKHEKYCARRRQISKLSLHLNTWHRTAPDAAAL